MRLLNYGVGEDSWEVSWTAWRSNQSILKEINPEYSLEGLMLKLKLQYFGHLTRRANSLGKTRILGKIEGRRRSRQQRTRELDGIPDSMNNKSGQVLRDGKGQRSRESWNLWGCKELDTAKRLNKKPSILLVSIYMEYLLPFLTFSLHVSLTSGVSLM